MPSSYPITGIFNDVDGTTPIRSVLVTARNVNNDEYLAPVLTNASGAYSLDLMNLNTEYANGDFIEVYAYKDKKYGVHRFNVDASVGSESKNFTAFAVNYTDPSQIAGMLGLTKSFTLTSKPNIARVCEIISRAEDEIDYRTGHAWRLRYSETNSGQETTANWEYNNIEFGQKSMAGTPVFLKHRKIRTISSFEIFMGGEPYEDWKNDKTEGRDDDWWCDYDRGILFLRFFYSKPASMKLRIKYTYGETTVNKLIEDIATKTVLIDLVQTEDRSILLPEGTSNVSLLSKIQLWKEEIEQNISRLIEWRTSQMELV